MQWIPQVLQRPVVKKPVRTPGFQSEVSQELELLWGKTVTEHRILQELGEPRLILVSPDIVFLNKFKLPRFAWGERFVQRNFHGEGGEVDIPASDQRVQERDAIFV